MNQAVLRHEIDIQAPPERVWQFISTEEGLRQWWGNGISLEPKEGGRCAEKSHVQGEMRHLTGVVTVYDPPRQLTLTLQPEHNPGHWPALTTISIILQQEAEQTRVTLVHQAFAVAPLADAVNAMTPAGPSAMSDPQLSLALGSLGSTRRSQSVSDTATFGKLRNFAEGLHGPLVTTLSCAEDQTSLWKGRLTALRNAILA